LISLGLFVHLFALAVAILSNGDSSPLMRAAARVTRPYMQLLAMNQHYRFYLTYGDELDSNYTIEIARKLPDGSLEPVASFPTPQTSPGLRYHRYGLLASYTALQAQVAEDTGENEMKGVLPRAFARSVFLESGAYDQRLVVRCRGHRPLNRDDLASPDAGRRDPLDGRHYFTKYEAESWWSGGQVQLLEAAAAAESSPASTRSSGAAPAQPPQPPSP
jgi:hypothetical protein